MGDIKCQYCPRAFPNEGALGTHLKWKHTQQPTSLLTCDQCGKVFKYLSKLRYHISRKHSEASSVKTVSKKPEDNPFGCVYCNFVCYVRDELYQHYSDSHGQDMTEFRLNFPSLQAFELWKTSFSKENNSWFINTGGWPKKDGTKCLVYKCHRDGFLKPSGQNKRLLKSLGSYKINGHCTAHIKAYVGPSGVDITYIKTHVGHETDLAHLKLSSAEREHVVAELFSKVPMDTVLDNIKDSSLNNELQRHHLLTRKDLWDASVNNCNNNNLNDWIKSMQEASNIVRLFISKRPPDLLCPRLEDSDMFLVLGTDAQIDMLNKHIGGTICIDNVYGPPGAEYNLFAVIVLDMLRQSFPVAFMLSSRADSSALEVMFHTLRSLLDAPTTTKVFLSPPEDKYYQAWSSVMGAANTRAFCPWHLDQAWTRHLSSISDIDKRAATFESIKRLQGEADFYAFDLAAAVTMYNLEQDPDTLSFAEYFGKFREEPSNWARCFWEPSTPCAHADPIHSTIRRAAHHQNITAALQALLHLARRRLTTRILSSVKSSLTTHLSRLRSRCSAASAAEEIEADADGRTWRVVGGPGGTQHVTPLHLNCDCQLKCSDCQACIHSYSCPCPDSVLHWNMCQHIHLLCRLLPLSERNKILPPVKRAIELPSSPGENEQDVDEPEPLKKSWKSVSMIVSTEPITVAERPNPAISESTIGRPESTVGISVVESISSTTPLPLSTAMETSSVLQPSEENSQAGRLLYQALVQPLECRCSIVCMECGGMIHSVECKRVPPPSTCKHRHLVYFPRKSDHDYAKQTGVPVVVPEEQKAELPTAEIVRNEILTDPPSQTIISPVVPQDE